MGANVSVNEWVIFGPTRGNSFFKMKYSFAFPASICQSSPASFKKAGENSSDKADTNLFILLNKYNSNFSISAYSIF